jgi:hypothetical protein
MQKDPGVLRTVSLDLLVPSTRLLLRNVETDFSFLCRNKMVVFDPSSSGMWEIWCHYFTSFTVNENPVRNEEVKIFLRFLLLLMIISFKQEVSGMVLHTTLRFSLFL